MDLIYNELLQCYTSGNGHMVYMKRNERNGEYAVKVFDVKRNHKEIVFTSFDFDSAYSKMEIYMNRYCAFHPSGMCL